MALFYVFGYPDPATGEGLDPFAYRSDATITERTLDISATGPFELFGRHHELVVGFNGSNSSNTGREYAPGEMAPVGDFFEWDGSYPEPTFDATGVLLSDIDTRQRGVYAAARFSLADPLKLIAGARRASWKIDSFYLYDVPPDGPPDYRARFDYNETIPVRRPRLRHQPQPVGVRQLYRHLPAADRARHRQPLARSRRRSQPGGRHQG